MGQLLSIPFIVLGTGFIIHGLVKTKKKSDQRTTVKLLPVQRQSQGYSSYQSLVFLDPELF